MAIYRTVGSSSVLPELLRSVRKETLNTVQFLRNGAVRLTFKSSADCDHTLAAGIRYGEVPLRVVSVETRSRLVYLRDCPTEVPGDTVKRFFASELGRSIPFPAVLIRASLAFWPATVLSSCP